MHILVMWNVHHAETIEYIEKYKLCRQVTWEFLGFRMQNFHNIFVWTQTSREIKSMLDRQHLF